MKIWIDFNNSSIVLFFKSIIEYFKKGHFFYNTCRDFVEIIPLLQQNGIQYKIIRDHYGKTLAKKVISVFKRCLELYYKLPQFDVGMHFATIYGVYPTLFRKCLNIGFNDNENSISHNYVLRYLDFLFIPNEIPLYSFSKFKIPEERIIPFNGLKEHIYIADFKPNPTFTEQLPFKEYIVLRPEARYANYVLKKKSLVPDILKILKKENVNILYLPRYEEDRQFSKHFSNIYIPSNPLNGLDICYYSKAVLTGSGTFTREAACLGKPAISFYPKELLWVDKSLIQQKKVFHTLDSQEIIHYIFNSKDQKNEIVAAKRYQQSLFKKISNVLSREEKRVVN